MKLIAIALVLLGPVVAAQPLPPRYTCDGMASDLPCELSHVRDMPSRSAPVFVDAPVKQRAVETARYPDSGGPMFYQRSSPMWGSDAPVEFRKNYVTPFGTISTNRPLGISSSSRNSMQFQDGTSITVRPNAPLKR